MDWQVGDLALCVGGNPHWVNADGSVSDGPDPVSGKIYKVVGFDHSGWTLALWIEGYPDDSYYEHNFRRIRPDSTEAGDKCEQLLTLLKRRRVDA